MSHPEFIAPVGAAISLASLWIFFWFIARDPDAKRKGDGDG